jgi:hypothetical protein
MGASASSISYWEVNAPQNPCKQRACDAPLLFGFDLADDLIRQSASSAARKERSRARLPGGMDLAAANAE